MIEEKKQSATAGRSGIGQVAFWITLSLLAAAAICPWVWRLLLWIGRTWHWAEPLRDLTLADVAARTFTLAVLLFSVPILRRAGYRHLRDLWGPADGKALRQLFGGFLLGAAAVALVSTAGVLCGAYRLEEKDLILRRLAGNLTGFAIAGMVVALVEETIFRGGFYGLLRRSYRFWPAAALAGLIYSAAHFAKPEPPVPPVYARWYEGFLLLKYSFAGTWHWHDGFAFLTLFFLGLMFCLTYEKTGRLYLAAGLHAGLVLAVKISGRLLDRVPGGWLIFGPSAGLLKAPAATVLSLVLLAAGAWWLRSNGDDS